MSYDMGAYKDEFFCYDRFYDAYFIEHYLKSDDPSVTELEIPAEYNGLPVEMIKHHAFARSKFIKRVKIPASVRVIDVRAFFECPTLESVELCEGLENIETDAFSGTSLKSIVLPKSIRSVCNAAFQSCTELERVEFNSTPEIGRLAFGNCPKLPPEMIVMGLVCSTDITRPFLKQNMEKTMSALSALSDLFRPDVFELLLKNDCFKNCNKQLLLRKIVQCNKPELLSLAEQYKMPIRERLLNRLIDYSAECRSVECTAYLLELKNRKFGFTGGSDFEL